MKIRTGVVWAGIGMLLAAVGTAGGMILYTFPPSHYALYPQCLFHRWTGLDCPGCGSLRALHQLLHGHLLTALHDNALLILSLPVLGWMAVRQFLWWRAGNGRTWLTVCLRPAFGWWLIGIVIAFAVLRNLPFEPFKWFAP